MTWLDSRHNFCDSTRVTIFSDLNSFSSRFVKDVMIQFETQLSWKDLTGAAIGVPEPQERKFPHCGSKQQ